MAGLMGELCEQIPSQLEGRMLIFAVGPHGAGAVAPAHGDMMNVVRHMSEANDGHIDTVRMAQEVATYLMRSDPDESDDAVLTFNRALACATWLAFNAKPPGDQPYRWIAFGLIGEDFSLAAGHDDATYVATRNMLIQRGAAEYAPQTIQAGIKMEPGSRTLH